MRRLWLTPGKAVAFVVAVVMLSYPATWFAWTGWPWSPLRLAVMVLALWAVGTRASRVAIVVAAVLLVLLCPLLAIQVADEPQWSGTPSGRDVGAAIGSHSLVRWHGVPAGWMFFSTRDKAYLNGEGDYADEDLVATAVTLLPWPSLHRETVIGLGGNTIEFWAVDDPQLRRDGDGLIVTSTRYYNGHEHWWDRRRIALGSTADLLTIAAWFAFAVLLGSRFVGSRGTVTGGEHRPVGG